MNREECIADAYLRSTGFKDIVFEPDGNVSPDFLIDGNIAVEVRRLNQNYFIEDEASGLEESRIPLFKLIELSLGKFDEQYNGFTYWVSVRFHRPIGTGNANKIAIANALTDFLRKQSMQSLEYNIKVTDNIYFRIRPAESVEGRVFRFAGGTDRESGGWVLNEFKMNFDYCVNEKSKNVGGRYNKYNIWWLILVDKIAYDFDKDERETIISMVRVNSFWEKVIVLNGLNGNNILEI